MDDDTKGNSLEIESRTRAKGEWFALYSKPKCENSIVTLLNNAGIETLNPKIQTRKYIKGKYTLVIEQLFPNYVFAFLDSESEIHMVKYTRGVRYIVGKGKPVAVPF